MTKTTPLWEGEIFIPGVGLAVVDPLAKFRVYLHSFQKYRRGLNVFKWSRDGDADHAPFRGNFFHPWGEPCHTRPIFTNLKSVAPSIPKNIKGV